ncbi:TPA: biotin--[acetyl-CoA-carboxylase] ligase [Bacillus anthracis]|nr:biotin--[acetyl-CoA-carboxylase] ligase [Bacillus anthracis]
MRSKILEELYINKGNHISGEVLRTKLGVSRTAIWKHINALKEEGYNIETIPRKGYMLLEMKDKLLPKEIGSLISNNAIGQEIVYFDRIDSTNSYAKKEANKLKDGTVILSEEQLLGRGRRGRNWSSPKGTGIWMSLVLKPNIPPTEGVKMTQIAAAAVCKAIRELTGLNALIKWPNDIVINGKKICGILTEMAGELNEVNYIIVGIGINVNTDGFACELKEKATSLFIEGGKKIDRKELVVNILKNFEVLYNNYIKDLDLDETLVIVKNYSAILGKEIKIIQGNLEKKARAIDINNEGLLLVQMDGGSKELISSGEVSIRGENGYI